MPTVFRETSDKATQTDFNNLFGVAENLDAIASEFKKILDNHSYYNPVDSNLDDGHTSSSETSRESRPGTPTPVPAAAPAVAQASSSSDIGSANNPSERIPACNESESHGELVVAYNPQAVDPKSGMVVSLCRDKKSGKLSWVKIGKIPMQPQALCVDPKTGKACWLPFSEAVSQVRARAAHKGEGRATSAQEKKRPKKRPHQDTTLVSSSNLLAKTSMPPSVSETTTPILNPNQEANGLPAATTASPASDRSRRQSSGQRIQRGSPILEKEKLTGGNETYLANENKEKALEVKAVETKRRRSTDSMTKNYRSGNKLHSQILESKRLRPAHELSSKRKRTSSRVQSRLAKRNRGSKSNKSKKMRQPPSLGGRGRGREGGRKKTLCYSFMETETEMRDEAMKALKKGPNSALDALSLVAFRAGRREMQRLSP
mmetsp:Transcript_18945/g.26388  ORF Transcript_18945/g.26388 Transcript_18945/m.26388 type:complete len:431 (-) Transcript_18945:595-1887(-)|eukprot:CAMPEP_0184500978 /NCGR_PEP_ID=MMETSP0113_2-20130426/46369_1 /TAXON_ID=91329 /ORGANISM="Norrisiella sphaerica, Strain BC52" /LENGTH=430 /DNA_ID=CAMNT_0026889579 /DNA_START=122 /DNA_END=1414 /DNA_ORIENTATION=-